MGLHQLLGLGSYQTAWSWLHKLRRAMVRPDRDRLNGCVEVDETYVGGEEEGVRGRQTEEKAIVVVAAEENGRGIGRIRLRRVPDASSQSLHPFIAESVRPGAVGSHGRMEGLSRHREEGLHPPGHNSQPKRRPGTQTDAPCAPRGFASEAVAAGDASRSGEREAFGLLPRRIHIPLQSPAFTGTWTAVLPPAAERRTSRSGTVPAARGREFKVRPQHVGCGPSKWIPPFGKFGLIQNGWSWYVGI